MSLYTVHVPDDAPDAMTRGEQTRFIREGFSLPAFVFSIAYLLWHRLWVAAGVWVLLLLTLAAFALTIHPPLVALIALAGLMHLYAGIEAPDLRRWGLARRGYTMQDVVSAPDRDAAETLFFTRRPETLRVRTPPAPVTRYGAPSTAPAVIGYPEGDGA